MLNYIWSGIFISCSLYAVFHSYQLDDEGKLEKASNWLFTSFGLAFLPFLLTWEEVGNPYLQFLRNTMPQSGELISEATSITVVVFTLAAFLSFIQYSGEVAYSIIGKKKKLSLPFNKRLTAIDTVLNGFDHGYGIFKRIDENRELLELLKKECPEFLDEHFWIEGWLKSHDQFFNELALAAKTENKRKNIRNFPRPWPGSNVIPN